MYAYFWLRKLIYILKSTSCTRIFVSFYFLIFILFIFLSLYHLFSYFFISFIFLFLYHFNILFLSLYHFILFQKGQCTSCTRIFISFYFIIFILFYFLIFISFLFFFVSFHYTSLHYIADQYNAYFWLKHTLKSTSGTRIFICV